jgi:hypothetical protein
MVRLVLPFLLCAAIGFAQSAFDSPTPANRRELLDGYHMWQVRHPETKSPTGSLVIHVPTIDLYSPTGEAVYHIDGDPTASAAFLKSLPTQLARYRTSKPNAPRPSLKEAIEMFSGLKGQENDLLTTGKYTIFALTFLQWDYAKAQNDAINDLRRRLKNANVQIIEIGQLQ